MELEVSREYAKLKRRGFRPYSEGHRIMYEHPLALIRQVNRTTRRPYIVEAGFGIGYGLARMLEAACFNHYVGFEPDRDSFNYTAKEVVPARMRDCTTLLNEPFSPESFEGYADHAFCIEVIEHVPLEDQEEFVAGLREVLLPFGTLWLSTPSMERNEHGVRETGDWLNLIRRSGFTRSVVHDDQWTTLYVCQP